MVSEIGNKEPAAPNNEGGVKRRGLLRFGTLVTAVTGASAVSAIAASSASAAPGDKTPPNTYVPVAEKGSPSGVATLDVNAKILPTQIPDLSAAYGTNTVLATSERFAGIDPTGTADSSLGIQAAIDAVPEGGTVIIPVGTYNIGTRITKSGKSFTLQAFGARFMKTVNDALFDFIGTYESPIPVISLSIAMITDDTAGADTGTAILVSSAPTSWVRGDIVKVYANDVIPGGKPGSGGLEARVGQFLVVSNVTGNVINCIGTLDDGYSANIRVAKLTNKAVHIRGGIFATHASGLTGSWTTNMIQFRSMVGPTVRDVQIESTSYTGFRFTGCYGYTVDSCEVNYAKNDSVNGINGYGVQDNSCSYGRISNYRARRVRHAYTDGSPFIAPDTADPANYGRSYGARISNSVAYGTANTAWDTHSWSQNTTFSDVQAVSSFKAFDARGRKHKFIDCSAIKCQAGGLYIANDSTGGETWGHFVKDFYAEDVPFRAIEVNINQTGSGSAGVREIRQCTIDGATIVGGGQDSIYIVNATVRLDRLRFTAASTVPSNEKFAFVQNGVLEGRDWVQDVRPVTNGAGMSLIKLSSSSTFVVDAWKYITTSSQTGVVSYGIDGVGSDCTAIVRDLVSTHPIGIQYRSLSGKSVIDWECLEDGQNSAWITASDGSISSSTGAVAALQRTRAREVWFRLTANGGAQTLPSFLDDVRPPRGQRLIIWNISTTNSITVKHGQIGYKTSLLGNTDKILNPQERITLVWQNSLWWQV